jgi:Mechanosensitive ion channel
MYMTLSHRYCCSRALSTLSKIPGHGDDHCTKVSSKGFLWSSSLIFSSQLAFLNGQHKFSDLMILVIELSLMETPAMTTKGQRHHGLWKVRLFGRWSWANYGDFGETRNLKRFANIHGIHLFEDISLFDTTLRFAMTGEVATISNGTIAQARITNLNRSKASNIVLDIVFHIALHDKDNLQVYTGKIQDYIDSNPNVYDGINSFQCEAIDTNLESVTYKLSVRCRVSWQNAKRVFVHRGNLHRQCIAIAREMKVEHDIPESKNAIYFAGSLQEGVQSHGRDLVEAKKTTRGTGR